VTIDFKKEVDYVANLARMSLEPDEKERMAGQLGSILDHARKIQELNTEGVEPTSHVTELPAVLRDDENKPSLPLNRVLQNAPLRQKDYFRVPSITSSDRTDE
jgi:aspartyl-tRNA(Asn)/glutamyl-tRNA(Gln) amidotransferase subunit C